VCRWNAKEAIRDARGLGFKSCGLQGWRCLLPLFFDPVIPVARLGSKAHFYTSGQI
jgi:hypothetical protein